MFIPATTILLILLALPVMAHPGLGVEADGHRHWYHAAGLGAIAVCFRAHPDRPEAASKAKDRTS